jgi:hypothetical protein
LATQPILKIGLKNTILAKYLLPNIEGLSKYYLSKNAKVYRRLKNENAIGRVELAEEI